MSDSDHFCSRNTWSYLITHWIHAVEIRGAVCCSLDSGSVFDKYWLILAMFLVRVVARVVAKFGKGTVKV